MDNGTTISISPLQDLEWVPPILLINEIAVIYCPDNGTLFGLRFGTNVFRAGTAARSSKNFV